MSRLLRISLAPSLLRLAAAALVGAALPAALPAQGWIVVPRPCDDCPPPPCGPAERCVPGDAQVRRISSDVRATLRDRVLSYEVTEIFHNTGGRLGEADYLFPLPRDAAFQDLQLEINGELVSGETLGAGEARRIYEDIVRRQKDPALVEWMGHGLLRTRIFPIAPGERKKVVVRFQMVAEREGDAVRVDYFRGSRFEGTGRAVEGRRPAADGRVAFELMVLNAAAYGDPYSPTHEIEVDDGRGARRVSVRGNAREVLVLLPLRRQREASVAVLTHAPRDGEGFALVRLAPPAGSARTMPRDVTLVLDVSGSMRGRKMEQAKAAGHQLLASLDSRDRFRLVRFSTDVESFRDGFVAATRENVREAGRWLDDLEAEGSTNISGALEEALDAPAVSGRLPIVLFMTDGSPTVGLRDPGAIADLARRERGERRLFTFGVGADVNTALVEQLALEGRGTAHFVRPEEDVERAVAVVAGRLRGPVATDLRLRAEGVRLEQVMPSAASDLFAGEDLVVLARYETPGGRDVRGARIWFEGRTPDGPVRWETTARFPERERDNAFVPRLWATRRIGWLSAERRRSGANAEIDGEIRRLGETYGIPTELTSYLVLEPGMDPRIANGAAVRRDMTDASAVAPQASSGLQGRAAGAPVQLEAVVTTGAAAPPAPASPRRREADFSAAKAAAEQRAASNVAEADSLALDALGRSGGTVRRIGDRVFTLVDGRWTDSRYTKGMTVRAVKPYSPAYFELVRAIPELGDAFALGDRVLVAGASVAIEVGAAGAETLSEREIASVVQAWRGSSR